MGARMLEAYPYVGVIDTLGLIVAILSYDGHLHFGLCADSELMSDLDALVAGIEKSIVELTMGVS
jgi:hypothetical protein